MLNQTIERLEEENRALRRILALSEENLRLREAVGALATAVGPHQIALVELAAAVAAEHGLALGDLRGPDRTARIVLARQHFMWLARQPAFPGGAPQYSLPEIGAFLYRDHTTVLHGAREHAKRLADAREQAKRLAAADEGAGA